jgi:hypothetical protein
MTSTDSLRYLLAQAASGTITTRELSELIHITRSLAESYLNNHRRSILRLCTFHGITEADLASDCIGELFETDNANRCIQIQQFLQALEQGGAGYTNFDVFLAYKSLVVKFVSTQLARSFAQIDPAGAKILRNVKDAINHSALLALKESVLGRVVTVVEADTLERCEAFPQNLLENELASRRPVINEIPELLHTLASIFMQQHQYRRSVLLVDFVQMIKKLYARFTEPEETTSIDLRSLEAEDLNLLQRQVLFAVNEKIISTYLFKQKITRKEAEKLMRVLYSIIVDWFEEGISENSLYEYTRAEFGVSEAQYNALWRARVEYLTRIARKTIKEYFSENV